jgi:hypothetical protein
VAQPLAGNFELAPEQERNFEVVVEEPGFVLIQLGWDVTGNGLLVKLEVAEDDPAVARKLKSAGAPLVLLEEELTEPTGEYRVLVGEDYVDVKLRVLLRNDTPDPTDGSVSVFFQRMPPATATATMTPIPTVTNTPVSTSTATPVPTATDTPVPTATDTPVPTATDTPVPTATNTPVPTPTNTPAPTATNTPVIKLTPIILTPIFGITFVIPSLPSFSFP